MLIFTSNARACQALHIPFQGFLYRGEIGQFYTWNSALASWQLKHLLNEDVWYTASDYLFAKNKK